MRLTDKTLLVKRKRDYVVELKELLAKGGKDRGSVSELASEYCKRELKIDPGKIQFISLTW